MSNNSNNVWGKFGSFIVRLSCVGQPEGSKCEYTHVVRDKGLSTSAHRHGSRVTWFNEFTND